MDYVLIAAIVVWALLMLHILGFIRIELVQMLPGNRMVRVGFGRNEFRWFFRIDLWFYGIRVTEG